MLGMKIFVVCCAWVLCAGVAAAADRVSARAAFEALPAKYSEGVLKLTADNARPNPTTWYFTAQAGGSTSPMHSITVESGQVVQDKLMLGIRELITNPSPIHFGKVLVDSASAYEIAKRYVSANQQELGDVSFALNQKGSDATPIWSIWCYAAGGGYLGRLDVLASDGSVILNEGFPIAP